MLLSANQMILHKQKKRQVRVWISIQFVIFKPWKVLWTWIDYIEIRVVMSREYSGKFSQRQCKIQLSKDNLGEEKVLESSFCGISKSLKLIINYWVNQLLS